MNTSFGVVCWRRGLAAASFMSSAWLFACATCISGSTSGSNIFNFSSSRNSPAAVPTSKDHTMASSRLGLSKPGLRGSCMQALLQSAFYLAHVFVSSPTLSSCALCFSELASLAGGRQLLLLLVRQPLIPLPVLIKDGPAPLFYQLPCYAPAHPAQGLSMAMHALKVPATKAAAASSLLSHWSHKPSVDPSLFRCAPALTIN